MTIGYRGNEMNVNIELFDKEPIENLITCLNFQIDKVVYFGYYDVMTQDAMETTRKSLKKVNNTIETEFIEVSRKDLFKVVDALERVVERETKAGNKCFFDLTGGEDLVLVAMGILSTKYDCPMHRFEVSTGTLRMMNKFDVPGIEAVIERRNLNLTLDDIIGFQGGVLFYDDEQEYQKHLDEDDFLTDVKAMWSIAATDNRKWNALCGVIKECNDYVDEAGSVAVSKRYLENAVMQVRKLGSFENFYSYLERLQNKGVLYDVKKDENKVFFTYKNESMHEILTDAGKLLELVTYFQMKRSGRYSDCRTGIKIDWDGVHKNDKTDVRNEIDVMLLEGYTPIFISCKNGKVDQIPLYELDTVADRFGGKYVIKQMSLGEKMHVTHFCRAKEMEITPFIPKQDALNNQ